MEIRNCEFKEDKLYLSENLNELGSRFLTVIASLTGELEIENSNFECAKTSYCDINQEYDLSVEKKGIAIDTLGSFTLTQSSISNCYGKPEG